jgi:hypothetical protein
MSDAAYYRAEAQRMLDWADTSPDPRMARRWRRLAEDYTSLAEQLETKPTGRPPILTPPVQRQPMQQQQTKATGGGGDK